MPTLLAARAANAAFSPSYFPVAVFVGGTSGIGRACAEAFAQYTKGNAHIVLVGRNKAAADEILASFPTPTAPDAKHEFLAADVFLMRNIQAATETLRTQLPKINFLVLSPGLLNMRGRDETEEGIDKRLGLHYYARWKFIDDLLPLVRKAKEAGEDGKVMSVLAAGKGGPVDLDNLGMKKGYNVARAGLTSPTYTDLMFERLTKENPDIAFVHTYPGIVRTPLIQVSHWALRPLNVVSSFLATPAEECAEYMLYSLFQTKKGFSRRDERGDDIGRKRWYGTADERDRVWDHSRSEVERALSKMDWGAA